MNKPNQSVCEVVSVKQNNIASKEEKVGLLDKLNSWLKSNKLSGGKGSKLFVPILLLGVILVLYLSMGFSDSVTSTSSTADESSVNFTSGLDYINQIEDKLENLLGSIKNAGKTSVMISIDSSPKLTIAENVEEKTVTTSSGTTVTTITEPIIITQNGESVPLVVMETLPEIKGVIVVSEGANDVKVKLDIITAVKALLDIPSSNIEVFSGV